MMLSNAFMRLALFGAALMMMLLGCNVRTVHGHGIPSLTNVAGNIFMTAFRKAKSNFEEQWTLELQKDDHMSIAEFAQQWAKDFPDYAAEVVKNKGKKYLAQEGMRLMRAYRNKVAGPFKSALAPFMEDVKLSFKEAKGKDPTLSYVDFTKTYVTTGFPKKAIKLLAEAMVRAALSFMENSNNPLMRKAAGDAQPLIHKFELEWQEHVKTHGKFESDAERIEFAKVFLDKNVKEWKNAIIKLGGRMLEKGANYLYKALTGPGSQLHIVNSHFAGTRELVSDFAEDDTDSLEKQMIQDIENNDEIVIPSSTERN